jgi:uncharacterized protein (DUF885 family)
MRIHFSLSLIAAVFTFTTLSFTASMHSQTANGLESRRNALKTLLDEEWQYELRESPEMATIYGDLRYNDKWSDLSLEHIAQTRKDAESFLARFRAIDISGFPEQEQINQQLMVRGYEDKLRSFELKNHEMPVDQFNGIQILLPQFASLVPTDSTKHYEDYLARLRQIPVLLDQAIALLREGEKDHLMPPKYLLEKVVAQCQSVAAPAGEASPFGQPLAHFPATVSADDRSRLRDGILSAIDGKVRPAYEKLAKFIQDEYAPRGRSEPGMWSMPDGEARYRFAVRTQTTTDMDPEQIHQLGLAQVKEIEAQMALIAQKLGFADVKSLRKSIAGNPKLTPTSGEQILELYRGYIAQMEPKLPQLFGTLPKAKVQVVPVEPFREKEAAGAEYMEGTPDGSRKGRVYVNTSDFAHRNLLDVEATAYHEGVPGHHMQVSIAQELPTLPPFRQHAQYNAYVEGWALYAERVGKELGFYQDPYSDYGRLTSELFRASRLVVDTGVHAKHWTRQQMVDFMREHSDEAEPDLQAEVDRYIAYPAQALSYKLGQLKFLELRERAKARLGSRFDLRAFHDEMLNGGALPLDVLESRTDVWIASQSGSTTK